LGLSKGGEEDATFLSEWILQPDKYYSIQIVANGLSLTALCFFTFYMAGASS